MCVIIIKKKGLNVPEQVLKNSAEINPHGLGVVWLDTFEVSYHDSDEYDILNTDRAYIAHFRYATIGAVNRANTHPFKCGAADHELLMMNGTIRGLGNSKHTDSKMLAELLGGMPRRNWSKYLSQYDSRFVTINTARKTFQIHNKNLFTYKDGVWYSKANVLESHTIAVYGTLKRGFSNNRAYLRDARYLGQGETVDKYPLIVSGLPYMVNHKGVGHNVVVDVYNVNNRQLKNIDMLEGHPNWYKRSQIKVKLDGREVLAWVYFNPKKLTKHTKLHKSFESVRRAGLNVLQERYDREETHEAINFGFDEDDFPTNETPCCTDCFGDLELEHDGFHNYYCSSCGGFFTEHEVIRSTR